MVRTIVTSHTYRQVVDRRRSEMLARDPDNRDSARQSRFRLDAELVRDNALAISGLLVIQDRRAERQAVSAGRLLGEPELSRCATYNADTGESQYRRGLYTWWQRTLPASEHARLRRPEPRGVRRRPQPLEHPAAGAGAAERPDLRRSRSRARRADRAAKGAPKVDEPDRPGPGVTRLARSAASDEYGREPVALLDEAPASQYRRPTRQRPRRCSRSGIDAGPERGRPSRARRLDERGARDPEPPRNDHAGTSR